MIKRVLHFLAAQPWIYDLIQRLAGSAIIRNYVAQQLSGYISQNETILVLDIGGGTGLNREMLPMSCIYICLDVDYVKLQGFLKKYPDEMALLANATHLPVSSESIDFILCTFVSHHISSELLDHLFEDGERVLKRDGKLIFLDPIWNENRWISRILWKYDRGSYPRSQNQLIGVISNHFPIQRNEIFSVYHDYLFCIAMKTALS